MFKVQILEDKVGVVGKVPTDVDVELTPLNMDHWSCQLQAFWSEYQNFDKPAAEEQRRDHSKGKG